MAILRIERGEKAPYEIELGAEEFDIGRGPDNALNFRDPWLSRHHARILWQDERHHLTDLASRNGTYLNGSKLVGLLALEHGDSIVLGDIELRFLETPSGALKISESSSFDSDSTVMLSIDDLVFERYREPAAESGKSVAGESLLPALNTAAAALISHYPLDELVEKILILAQEAVGAERGALLLRRLDGDRQLEVKSFHGFASGDEVRVSQTITAEVLHRKKAILTLDAQADERFDAALSLQLEGVRSMICVPLWNNREVTGMVYLDHRVASRTFSSRDLRLVGLIANMAAVKIENVYLLEEQIEKRRMEDQLAVAAKIQRNLLPSESPRVEGYDIRGATRPCFEIGGDYYDFIPLGPDKLAVVIADIAGKGVGAALLMAVLQASLRALIHTILEPVALVSNLNRVLLDNSPDNRFATLFYGELDTSTHTLEYVSGGHNPALLVTAESIEELWPTGPIVGLMSQASYTSKRVSLPPASTLLLYTDGVTELTSPEREEFGTERLTKLLQDHLESSAFDLLGIIGKTMTEFSEGVSFDDDSTAVVVRRLPVD